MDQCPTCGSRVIGLWQKNHATSTSPARCSQCGALCRLGDSVNAAGVLLAEVLFWGSIVLALAARSWWMLFLLPIGMAGWILAVGQFATLMPTDEQAVAERNFQGLRFLLMLAMLLAIGYAFLGDS